MTDSPSVVTADRGLELIRVGWLVAELRGRTRLGALAELDAAQCPVSETHALLLLPERPAQERLNSTQLSVIALGGASGLEVGCDGMHSVEGHNRHNGGVDGWKRAVELSALVPDRHAHGWRERWEVFASALYLLDQQVQDALSWATYGELSAYLLGRALAETSWALEPSADPGALESWEYLLGEDRCLTISGMVERLTCHVIPSDVSQAIRGSLSAWHRVVAAGQVRDDETSAGRLRQQADLWRDLLLSGADPEAIVPPKATLMHVSSLRPVARMLLPQLVTGIVSAAFLGVAAWLFTSQHAAGGPTGAVIGVFSVLGLTGSAISAKAKSDVNGTLGKLQTALQVDLIVERATILPDGASHQHRKVRVSVPGELADPVQHEAADAGGSQGRQAGHHGRSRKRAGGKRSSQKHGAPRAGVTQEPRSLDSTPTAA